MKPVHNFTKMFHYRCLKGLFADVLQSRCSSKFHQILSSYSPLMQKQHTYHQQHQSQYQQPVAQHLHILKSSNLQNSVLKSQYAMHQREQLKSNHQDQQKGNKKEVSKTNQETESLLAVPGGRSYKETLITQRKM